MAMVGEDKVPDISADFAVAKDRGESPAEMEPLLIGETSRFRGSLTDFAVELAQKAAGIRRSLPESLLKSLADLVRSMNCYYRDRKSTRLNSSHGYISYAVFCLKKKKTERQCARIRT